MECFLDTNIPLAYVFSIEPNHKKANYIFNEYDKLFWSKLVLNEFNNRFNIKYQHITDFYQEYKFFLKHSSKENIQIGDIEKYARKKDYPKKYEKDVLESISLFWNKYLGIETFVEIHRFLSKINDFLNDLKKSRYHNKNHCQQRIIITALLQSYFLIIFV